MLLFLLTRYGRLSINLSQMFGCETYFIYLRGNMHGRRCLDDEEDYIHVGYDVYAFRRDGFPAARVKECVCD